MSDEKHPTIQTSRERTQGSGRWKKIIVLVLVVLLFQLVAYRHQILNGLGAYLVYEEPSRQADVIAVLNNWHETITRTRGAVDLYQQGLANTIFVPRMKRMTGVEEMTQRGLTVPEHRDIVVSIMKKLNVPQADIVTSDQEATSTKEEAEVLAHATRQNGWKRVIVVTSKYHSRRAYVICKDAVRDTATVISVPTPYDPYEAKGWWQRPEDRRHVALEYQKLLLYYLQRVF